MVFGLSSSLPTPILRLHPEIGGMFADEMDLLSISRWRATCSTNYRHGCSSMRRTLNTRLNAFVPYPLRLIDIVANNGALFGGEVALSFILREQPFQPTSLEIFASNFAFTELCSSILDDPPIRARIKQHTFLNHTLFDALRRLVTETLVIRLTNGKIIYVHQSYTCSPAAPISRSPCTALSNFVSAYGFGCSHPVLTLKRRALLADRELDFLSPTNAATLNLLLRHGFSLAVSPTAWPEFRRYVDETLENSEECWRDKYVCPNQGRYFGDRGSMVGFIDPLGGDEGKCVERSIAPFGPMVVWRLMSTFECDDGCEYLDEVMDNGVMSIPVVFKKDPYGELYDFVSDRHTPVAATLYRRFGRGRSLSI